MNSARPVIKVMFTMLSNHRVQTQLLWFQRSFFVAAALVASWSFAQDAAPADSAPTAKFAPGTVTVISPEPAAAETSIGPVELKEITENTELAWTAPTFPDGRPFYETQTRTLQEMAKQVYFRRTIYCLEFSFKPMRQMQASIPQPDGSLKQKLIWYLVFRVRHRGVDLLPAAEQRELGGASYSKLYSQIQGAIPGRGDSGRRFFPLFALRSENYEKEYLDRVIPAVIPEIALREKIYTKLHNTAEITAVPVPHSDDPDAPGIWGVATWEDLDPRIDFFSIYVDGLTNATERDEDGTIRRKVLQLNFFRPGDTIRMLDDRIRFGIPAFTDADEFAYALKQYGLSERLDYRWIFR